MFCPPALAARIDRAEMRLSLSIAETVASRTPGARVLVSPIAGGHAIFAGTGSPANKAIGIGFGAAIDEAALEAIEHAWADRGQPVRFELSTLADPSLVPTLTARGYRLTGFENVLARAVTVDDRAPDVNGMSIRVLPQDQWRPWMNVALDGFATPDGSAPGEESFPREALEGMFADFASTPGFQRYLLHVEGEPAGAASLRIDDGLAQLCGAATLPQFRRRGIQAALLRWRLADAREAGCALAVVTTQPGSKSQANAMRQGFALLYTRAVLVKPLAT
ncbi:MAG: GNAT family N-acetyltransferase [Vicinamibacteria bacterium]|nr:GNAT family N-acetyltransferase [Vicinamibacteria bacterium]